MVGRLTDVATLIGGIYDAAFEPALWSDTLIRITDAIGGAQVMMGIHDFATRSIRVIGPRMDPDHMRSYVDHWGSADILWQRTNRVPVGTVLLAERYMERSELMRTEFYNEWQRPMRLGAAA